MGDEPFSWNEFLIGWIRRDNIIGWHWKPEVAVSLSVEIGSYLRKYVPDYDPTVGAELEFQAGTTVRDAVGRLGIPVREASVVTVNRSAATLDQELKDGDLVGIFPVAMGG